MHADEKLSENKTIQNFKHLSEAVLALQLQIVSFLFGQIDTLSFRVIFLNVSLKTSRMK